MLELFRVPPNLASELLAFLNHQDCYELSQLKQLRVELEPHVGIYLLFYQGMNPLYHCITQANLNRCCLPIYIGKAVTGGRRIGKSGRKTPNLYSRLREHQTSIQKGSAIAVNEFKFKVVPMEYDLVSWGESVLIRHFQPVWNQIIDGFGNHDPGKGRYQQKRSVWDLIHPGREWSEKLKNFDPLDFDQITIQVNQLCQEMSQKLGC